MRKIAMRCTQEQFDSIKDRITYPMELLKFENPWIYLTNDYLKKKIVSTSAETEGREVYETFDAEIFLKACDSWEEEKIWKGEELEVRRVGEGYWRDANNDWEVRIKPQPNYDKEIEALQLKAKENGMKCVINFEKI